MLKAIIILMVLLGLFCYAMVVASARAGDREEYMRYEEWKKRKEKERNTDCQWR